MFVELKCKSNFSFLRGASDAREYVERASELRMPAVAISDINGVYGLPRAYEACKIFQDVKLIAGAELTLRGHPPLTLIAKTRKAYGILCKLLTSLHAGKEKGEGYLTLDQLNVCTGEDLIAIPDLTATTDLKNLKDIFGASLYLPLCRYLDGMDAERTELALEQASEYGIKIVATNEVHYHTASRSRLQDCLTCVREGVHLRNAGFKLFQNDQRYLKSPLQMRALFKDMPEAITETLEIADQCSFSLAELKYTYPQEFLPPGQTAQKYFEELVLRGAHKIYRGNISAAVDAQIQHEFRLIEKLGYANYFLTIYDIVEFAKSRNIICQGRGSAANSICCYCLGITAIDPVRMKLLFERFMSEERAEPPDIDVDFEHERREEVIQYIYQRYGRDRAAMVCAVRTYRSRSAFLELSKAIGVPVGVMTAKALEQNFANIAGKDADKLPVIQDLVQELKEFPRHLSIHSGGFTLSADPIIETVPVEPARMKDRTIIQWDKNDLDTIGLLKIDVLSLGFLTALHKCCDLLRMDWRHIPPEDKATYAMICKAETEGTFQIESRAQKAMLVRTHPKTFYDLVVQVAIVRPGPSVGQMIRPYLERREATRRGRPYKLPDPSLESALGRTYGVPIFQEQTMKIAIEKAGFNPGEADQLRRALAAWRSAEAVETMGKKLYAGLLKNGISKEWADELFNYLKGYAHYGFPESHAASFALIAYNSAYLKCHHPAEFLCALLNSQPMGFYSIDTLINDAKRRGVKVLPVHPNVSDWDTRMEGPMTLRMGFRNVRKIREEDIRHFNERNERELTESDIKSKVSKEDWEKSFQVLLAERNAAPFKNLTDFLQRTRFPAAVIELMALADVFACFGMDQRHSFWKSLEFKKLYHNEKVKQLSLFEVNPAGEKAENVFKPMTLYEQICAEYRALGYSLHGNAMTALRQMIPELPKMNSKEVRLLKHKEKVSFAGIMTVLQRPPPAKGTAFITLEDEHGSVDTIAKNEIFEMYAHIIQNNRFLIFHGHIQRIGTGCSIILESAESFTVKNSNPRPVERGQHARNIGTPVK
jgi:error-prone DNA polymerase